MTADALARDYIDSTIPVFPVARISKIVRRTHSEPCADLIESVVQVLDRFFGQANAACRRGEYEEPQSTFMTSRDVSSIRPRTEALVDEDLLKDWPWEGSSVQQIIDFALQYLNNTDLSPTNMVVFDDITNQDDTCLILSKDPFSNDPRTYVQVRSDFESAVVALKTIETGCGDADTQLDTNYEGSDGVLRISVRDRP